MCSVTSVSVVCGELEGGRKGVSHKGLRVQLGHPSGRRVLGPLCQALGVRLWTVYLLSHLLILSPELPCRVALCREVT